MFKPKSKFNRRNKDAAIELYLSSLKENLTKVEVPNDKRISYRLTGTGTQKNGPEKKKLV